MTSVQMISCYTKCNVRDAYYNKCTSGLTILNQNKYEQLQNQYNDEYRYVSTTVFVTMNNRSQKRDTNCDAISKLRTRGNACAHH